MAKCARCGASLSLLSFSSHCGDCKEALRQEELKRHAELHEAAARAERERQERLERERKSQAIDLAKSMKRRISAGEPVFLHEAVYLPVDSRVVDEVVCERFCFEALCKMGVEGWEVVGVVPRTVGIALTNRSLGTTMGESWGAGVGGNVAGVYVLLRLNATAATCTDQVLFDYALRRLVR